MKSGRDYTGIILEEIRDQLKALFEAVAMVQNSIKNLATKDALNEATDDVQTIESVLTATNREVQNHDVRITRLEKIIS